MSRHPMQPLAPDDKGVLRFKENAIVRWLLDNGGLDMNAIARHGFPAEEHEHFAQLIGYSLSGFGSLSYVSDATYATAVKMSEGTASAAAARIEALEETLTEIRTHLRSAAVAAFRVHPDDLEP